jgi:hypothetical protein
MRSASSRLALGPISPDVPVHVSVEVGAFRGEAVRALRTFDGEVVQGDDREAAYLARNTFFYV